MRTVNVVVTVFFLLLTRGLVRSTYTTTQLIRNSDLAQKIIYMKITFQTALNQTQGAFEA